MLVEELLLYKKFHGNLKNIGFEFSTYHPCVSNRISFVNKHTVRFYVDGTMHSHVSTKVNDNFKSCVNRNYGKHGELKSNKGEVHKYLGMNFDLVEKKRWKLRWINMLKG